MVHPPGTELNDSELPIQPPVPTRGGFHTRAHSQSGLTPLSGETILSENPLRFLTFTAASIDCTHKV